jgi:hypothetical protein
MVICYDIKANILSLNFVTIIHFSFQLNILRIVSQLLRKSLNLQVRAATLTLVWHLWS